MEATDVYPRFPGCEEASLPTDMARYQCSVDRLMDFVSTRVRYPDEARAAGIQGEAVVEFIVTKEGKVTFQQILEDPGSGLGEEAKRLVDIMVREEITWRPGYNADGEAVDVVFRLPVRFSLPGATEEKKGGELMLIVYDDNYFMRQALQEAVKGQDAGEVPVGAVIACGDRILARSHNRTEQLTDVTAHAEILCVTAAAEALGSKYLPDCTLYVTLEPCVMCAGALAWAQLGRVVYGAADEKRGFMRFGKTLLHPRTRIEYGILEEECARLLKGFFQARRNPV